MHGHLRKIAILIAAATLVSACSPAQTTPAPEGSGSSGAPITAAPTSGAAAKDTLIIAIPGLPNSVDLEQGVGSQTWTFAAQFVAYGLKFQQVKYPYTETVGDPGKVDGFTYPNLDFSALQPGVLESCKLENQGLSATIKIKAGVKSPYGNELTADDMVWGVQRAAALKSSGNFFNTVANAADPAQWKVVDKTTVSVTGTKPMAELCDLFTHVVFTYSKFYDSTEVKKHVTADDPWALKWLTNHTATYGPYNLTEWSPGSKAVMDANPNYYGGPLPFQKIVWQVAPESADRIALLKAGKVDLGEGISPEEAISLDGSSGVNVVSVRGNTELFALMNLQKKPFDDVRVRTALNLAVPREDIATGIFRGMAVPWAGVIPSIYTGYQDNHAYDTNLDKAKSLLAEAIGAGNRLPISLSYSAGDPVLEQVAILYQTSLKKIGVDLTLKKLPPAALSDVVTGGKLEFSLWADAPFLPDPVFSQGLWWWKDSGSMWSQWTHYDNPTFDAQASKCNDIIDWAARVACSNEMSPMIIADAPSVFIAQPNFIYAASSHLTGLNWNPALAYNIADGWAWKP